MGAVIQEYFPELEYSRSVTPSCLVHTCFMEEHYVTGQVSWLNSECCFTAVTYKHKKSVEDLNRLKSWLPLLQPGTGAFRYCSAPEECCMLHLFFSQSLFVRDNTVSCTLQTYTQFFFFQTPEIHKHRKLSLSDSLKLIFCLTSISNSGQTRFLSENRK